MSRFNFNSILLSSSADISKIAENFAILEEYGITETEVNSLINTLQNTITNYIDTQLNYKANKNGDTFSGNINLNNNQVKFNDSGNIEWKETGYGDKFRIVPDFNGSGNSNIFKIQATTGGANTDPADWVDLFTISAQNGNLSILGNITYNNKTIKDIATKNYSYGTNTPTGGSNGDIYDQYFI